MQRLKNSTPTTWLLDYELFLFFERGVLSGNPTTNNATLEKLNTNYLTDGYELLFKLLLDENTTVEQSPSSAFFTGGPNHK